MQKQESNPNNILNKRTMQRSEEGSEQAQRKYILKSNARVSSTNPIADRFNLFSRFSVFSPVNAATNSSQSVSDARFNSVKCFNPKETSLTNNEKALDEPSVKVKEDSGKEDEKMDSEKKIVKKAPKEFFCANTCQIM